MKATPIYRSIMLEVERRRVSLGLPMEKFSEWAGVPDRYFSKCLHADAPSGRQATWAVLDAIVGALYPNGYDVEIRAKPGRVISPDDLKARLLQLRATVDPKTQRELMRQLGSKGGERSGKTRREQAAARKVVKAQRQHAARMRWRTPQIVEITGVPPILPAAAKRASTKLVKASRPAV